MINRFVSQCSANWRRRLNLLLVVALMLPLMAVAPVQAPGLAGNIQPLLLQLAAEQPEATVSVIVQKAVKDTRVEDLVARLGGTVTKDLHIINAFTAELPGKAVTQLAGDASVKWVSLDAPVQSTATTTPMFTTWATQVGTVVANGFTNSANILGPAGPDQRFGSGSRAKGAFAGFQAEYNPRYKITRVEAVLRLYPSAKLGSSESLKVTPYVGGQPGTAKVVSTAALNAQNTTSTRIYLDITTSRTWSWRNFADGVELVIDATTLATNHTIYYDAIGIRVTTAAGSDTTSPVVLPSGVTEGVINTTVLTNTFNKTVRATDVWNVAPYRQGAGVTVAVVDSGSFKTNAIGSRLIGEVNFNSAEHTSNDQYGHGTFVTDILADDGSYSAGKYIGIAPKVNILGLRVSDDNGMSSESDVVNALQWVYDNRAAYNIRVVNLSLNSTAMQSYHTSPLDAACEILWFNGIVVVVSAGNNGTATLFPPANDPFVITVGATDEKATVSLADDIIASFSAYGVDEAGQAKPDLVAPGKSLIGYLPDTNSLTINVEHPENRVDSNYFRMSGTSVSAPLVSGAAALLLEDEPTLNPDQVKYRLKATANKTWPGYDPAKAGAGYLDIYAAVNGTTTQTANTGLYASNFLSTGNPPVSQTWGSAQWGSAQWGSAQWGSAQWGSAQWGSAQWGSDYWGP